MIYLLVYFLLAIDIIVAIEYQVRPLQIGTIGKIRCDHVKNDTKVRQVQWYKSETIDKFRNGDGSLAWRTGGESGSLPNYLMENTTFSLVIGNATLVDEGFYLCSVVRLVREDGEDLLRETNYYTSVVMYALPRMDPEITLDTGLNRVNCTVERVKPLTYPVLNCDWILDSIPQTYAVLNEDRTYTTSVSCALPQTKIVSRVDCSFFFLHYQRVVSRNLHDTTTHSLIEDKTSTVSPMGTSVTSEGDGNRAIKNVETTSAVITLALIASLFFVAAS